MTSLPETRVTSPRTPGASGTAGPSPRTGCGPALSTRNNRPATTATAIRMVTTRPLRVVKELVSLRARLPSDAKRAEDVTQARLSRSVAAVFMRHSSIRKGNAHKGTNQFLFFVDVLLGGLLC